MAVEATYAMNEYLATLLNAIVTPDTITFDPGDVAPRDSDNTFATYKLVQGRDYDQPYIHMDALTIRFYHTKFDTLQRMIDTVLGALNNENVYDNTALVAKAYTEGVRFKDVIATASNHTQNDFIDSTEYHVVPVDIMMQYIEL